MTGKEKIKQMLDSGEFAEIMEQREHCPSLFGLHRPRRGFITCWEKDNELQTKRCKNCWRKALESEVE